jgi:3-hydroxyisobutyrate dehydrogenase-like beta-hydroxyacid dehydrogenase
MSTKKNTSAATGRTDAGVIGLGIMGSAMSANLVKAGFAVHGYDPLPPARARLAAAGGNACRNAADVARRARFIILSLPSEAALEAACAQIIAAGKKDLIVAETSTLPLAAKERAQKLLKKHGIALLDCPLSGTGAQAVKRDLAIYASGDARAIREMAPVFEGFARARYDVGRFGNGIRMKLVANLLVAIHNVSAAEAILMGVRSGLDAADIVRVVADGAGGSRMFSVRGPMMVERTWGEATMKVSTWQKDMRLIGEALVETDTPAPLFAACIPIYNAAMAMGHGADDTGAVYSVLERMTAPLVSASPPARQPKARVKRGAK